ncbi:MAG: HAD family phosphatase [Chloroflexi bacterium]|nr:HAD family phosphatase [Chloroflexota bacterium]HOE34222.1 HAD family hydrolase [Anaerolineaceae bacterium]HOT25833.1 HAD family hydrolase [Anaerolineaceae bacterium]HQH58118.1 HAD family hydrolase [Anaerolineaceae bacterium]HQK04198.1 HAD family hydrolase [Anaerolineaceae bacterium]
MTVRTNSHRKLLALDLDGTTVDDHGQISDATAASLRLAREKGAAICFVTGRSEFEVLSLEPRFPYADYLVVDTGAKITALATGEVLLHECLDSRAAEIVIQYFLRKNRLLHIKAGRFWGATLMDETVEAFARYANYQPVIIREPADAPLTEIDSFCVYGPKSRAMMDRLIAREGLNLYTMHSQPHYYDVLQHGINKWRAVSFLAQRLNIPTEDIVAVGNFSNDVEMIRKSGLGVAVSNASDDAKAAADYITRRSNNRNAVGEVVEKFL